MDLVVDYEGGTEAAAFPMPVLYDEIPYPLSSESANYGPARYGFVEAVSFNEQTDELK